jgi:glucokinase
MGHQLIGADLSRGAPPASEHLPHEGSLERLAAGRALDGLGRDRGFDDGPAVVEAAKAGDAAAREAIDILGERLGIGIANAINVFDAERFVLRGVGTRTEIRLARYGPRAGVRGAALLAAQEVLHA